MKPLLAALVLALVVSVAQAAGPKKSKFEPDPVWDPAFRAADIDGDGFVSKAEAAGDETLVVRFFKADRDRDGKLSREEFEVLYEEKAKADVRAAKKAESLARAKQKDEKASTGGSSGASR